MTRFAWGAASDTGRVRQANEDALLAVDGLFVVADGMGGHRGGATASDVAVRTLRDRFTSAGTEVLVQAVQDANEAVVAEAAADPDLEGMGTTLCAMALVDDDGDDAIAVVNVGDSRLYLLSDGELTQITDDHSLVATMERQGRLTRAEAAVHPQRNILTRALGIDTKVIVDSWEITPVEGDRYLVCSDGLFNEVDDNRLSATLRRLADPQEAARELVRLANEGGGRDNVTCIVVDVLSDGGHDLSGRSAGSRITAVVAGADRLGAERGTADTDAGATSSGDAGGDEDQGERAEGRGRDPDRPRSRLTWRVAVFALALVAVVGVAVGAVVWAGTGTYYVALDDDQVAIFRGKPGGVLWIQPELAETTELDADQVPAAFRQDVEAGHETATLDDARRYVDNLVEQYERTTTTTTTSTTTTTTVPDPAAPVTVAPVIVP